MISSWRREILQPNCGCMTACSDSQTSSTVVCLQLDSRPSLTSYCARLQSLVATHVAMNLWMRDLRSDLQTSSTIGLLRVDSRLMLECKLLQLISDSQPLGNSRRTSQSLPMVRPVYIIVWVLTIKHDIATDHHASPAYYRWVAT